MLQLRHLLVVQAGCLVALAAVTPGSAGAQGPVVSEQIACGASSGNRQSCNASGNVTSVRIAKDLSGLCRPGANWGYTGSLIWTSGGCRADFQVSYRPRIGNVGTGNVGGNVGTGNVGGGNVGGGVVAPARTIRCGSASGNQVQCNTGGPATSVTLFRDLSGGRCRQGSNWGYTNAFIWAKGGCQADFRVSYGGGAAGPTTQTISCGYATNIRMECRTGGHATSVRLVRNLSGVRCIESSNWGFTDSSIWTNKGCRGEFEVALGPQPQPR